MKLYSHNIQINQRCPDCMAEGLQRAHYEDNRMTYEQLEAQVKHLEAELSEANKLARDSRERSRVDQLLHHDAISKLEQFKAKVKELLEAASSQENHDNSQAIQEAYGYLWHVNCGQDAPEGVAPPSITPEKAAYEAELTRLKESLVKEQDRSQKYFSMMQDRHAAARRLELREVTRKKVVMEDIKKAIACYADLYADNRDAASLQLDQEGVLEDEAYLHLLKLIESFIQNDKPEEFDLVALRMIKEIRALNPYKAPEMVAEIAERRLSNHIVDDNKMVQILSNDKIKEIFLSSGFTIKEGRTDLAPYVYEAARKLLGAASSQENHDNSQLNLDGSNDDPTARMHG